ncbi:MAG: hypothetical protein MJ181_10005 [Treponema sp.]|nr:hypothetical protein [Treponema sp.]
MKIKCIRCGKEYDTDIKEKYICTSCIKEIIQNNGNLAEEYTSLVTFKNCKNCQNAKKNGTEEPCKSCSFYSNWVLNWNN